MSDERDVEVPMDELSPAALQGVLDDYVLREGTDYGGTEVTLERKREQVLEQLRSGRARIVFDETTETCTIVVRDGYPRPQQR